MTVGARLATFGLVLVAAFAAAFGIGTLADDGADPEGGTVELDHVEPHAEGDDQGGEP